MNRLSGIVSRLTLILALFAGSHALAEGNPAAVVPSTARNLAGGTPLPAPKKLQAIPEEGGVRLKWKPVEGCDGYRLYWAGPGHVTRSRAQVTEVSPGHLQCKVSSLMPGVSYGFKVCALRSCVEGQMSRQIVAEPGGSDRRWRDGSLVLEKASQEDWLDRPKAKGPLPVPSLPPPGGLKAILQLEGALLTWKPVAGSTGYRIYWEKEGHVSGCSNRLEDLSPDQVSYQAGDLLPGTLYRFRVCTLQGSREGPLSREAGVKPKEKPAIKASDAAP